MVGWISIKDFRACQDSVLSVEISEDGLICSALGLGRAIAACNSKLNSQVSSCCDGAGTLDSSFS